MAIFKAGKRVGLFDISGGVSRGDFEDSAYHKTDRDIRIKQYANKDNTIGRFRASMAQAQGYARPARFAVRIFPPTNLESLIKKEQNVGYGEGQIDPGLAAAAREASKPDAKFMSDLSQTLGRQMNIHCDSVNLPAHDLTSEAVTHFGPPRSFVTGHNFTGLIAASFYGDKFLRERHFIEMWQKMAVNMTTHKAGYYDDYIGKMQIFQLGSMDGDGQRDSPTYGIEATEVYPETLSAVEYNYGTVNQIVKINVGFQFKQWHNLATDSIKGMDFASGKQVLHEVKPRDNGLFGQLPPELQRVGRGIFNTAKNQLPIGRIFKGKLFPPFT